MGVLLLMLDETMAAKWNKKSKIANDLTSELLPIPAKQTQYPDYYPSANSDHNFSELEKASEKLVDLGTYIGKYKGPPKVIKITETIAVKVPVPYPVKIPHEVIVPVDKPYPVPITKIVTVPEQLHFKGNHGNHHSDYNPSSSLSYENYQTSDVVSAHSTQHFSNPADNHYQPSQAKHYQQRSQGPSDNHFPSPEIYSTSFYDMAGSDDHNEAYFKGYDNHEAYPTQSTADSFTPTHTTLYNSAGFTYPSSTAHAAALDSPSSHRTANAALSHPLGTSGRYITKLNQHQKEEDIDHLYYRFGNSDLHGAHSAVEPTYLTRTLTNSRGQITLKDGSVISKNDKNPSRNK